MSSTIATIPAVTCDAETGPWTITDEDVFGVNAGIVRHDFAPRIDHDGITWNRRVEYLLPRRALPIDFADNQAIVNVDPAAVVRWETFEDHLKAEVVFTTKPAVLELWFAANFVGVTPTVDGVDIRLLDPITGSIVGTLPSPWLRDNTGTVHVLAWELGDGCLTAALPDLAPEIWPGAVFDPNTIDTSTATAPTGFGNQHSIVRLSTGVLVAVFAASGTNGEFWYSTDNGATWTQYSGADIAGWENGSIATYTSGGTVFLVAAWKQSGTGGSRTDDYIYFMPGTITGTTLTWGAAAAPGSNTSFDTPAITAFSDGAGGGHVAGVCWIGNQYAAYIRYPINSSGVLGTKTRDGLGDLLGWGAINASGAVVANTYPSIAVNPTTLDLGIVWSMANGGVGKGLRFIMAVHSAGSWAFNSERNIDFAHYVDAPGRWVRILFDGTRWVIVGQVLQTDATYDFVAHERDAGDTTDTPRELLSDQTTANRLDFGSASFDLDGNLYLFGVNQDEAAGSKDLVYRKWTRSGASLGSEVVLDSGVGDAYVSAKLGFSNTRIEILYTDGTGSPRDVRYESINLNTEPTAATWVTASGPKDVAANLALDWTFNDPDVGDTQSAYALKRTIGATTRWWDGTDWDATSEVKVTDTATIVTLASGWGADGDTDHSYQVKTWDASDGEGVYNTAVVITPSAKVNPTLDEPDDGEAVGTSRLDAEWTVAQQSAYRLRVLSAADAELWTSGWVTDTITRRRTLGYTLADATSYRVELTTKNTEGLESNVITNDIDVSYTPPPVPTLTAVPDAGGPGTADDLIQITITNPAPGGSEPALLNNDLYRREVGDTGSGIRIASGLGEDAVYDDYAVASGVPYEYLVRAFGDNNTSSDSDWTD